MEKLRIFIVEDDPFYGEMLKYHLSLNPDYEVQLFGTGKACLDNLHLKPAVITIDFDLPDIQGDVLMDRIKQRDDQIFFIIISGQEEVEVAIELLKKGAYDYLTKNENTREMLWNSILKLRENLRLRKEVDELKDQLVSRFDFQKTIIGQSASLKKVFSLIQKATQTNINVSINGETGTGKELVAKAIHYNSERSKKPFVAVNMSAIPSELIESELFGHEKGAFTGASEQRKGKFEHADGGTVFLDEIAEMDISLQSKMLRVLQEREVVRVGGNKPVSFKARLITATHKNLAEEVKKGTFREDLYYRIMGLPIPMPPLRERGNDILLLARHFIKSFAKENQMPDMSLSQDAKEKLLKYPYPGNVRELKAITDLACVMTDSDVIEAEHINFNSVGKEEKFLIGKPKSLREYTADIIHHFLKENDQNVVKVAQMLDIGKSTIYNLIRKGDIELEK